VRTRSYRLVITWQMWLRIAAGTVASVLFAVSLWYMIVKLQPSKVNFPYWEEHDDWN
jgi:elongation factor P hydroxylase